MTSAAAIAGIGANGLRWRYHIRLGSLAAKLGEPDNLTEEELAGIRDAIVKKVKDFCETDNLYADMVNELIDDSENLEMVDLDVDEIREALNRLYDSFDFWRVCVL